MTPAAWPESTSSWLPHTTTRNLVVLLMETGLRGGDACHLPFNPVLTESFRWPTEEEHHGEAGLLDDEQTADQAVGVEVEPQAGLGEQGSDDGTGEVNRDPGEPLGARARRGSGTPVPYLRPAIGAVAG